MQNSREQAVDKYWIDTKKERGSLYFSLIPSLQGSLIASAPEISNADTTPIQRQISCNNQNDK
ncbi:hypothetical protein, partial [Prevotella pectinovora]|uniref:hypothetical protein n=1 Tax=Prevotella pectinovora TaxID=1602169 RepID=UPI0030803D69